jgi:hypothetical protein
VKLKRLSKEDSLCVQVQYYPANKNIFLKRRKSPKKKAEMPLAQR